MLLSGANSPAASKISVARGVLDRIDSSLEWLQKLREKLRRVDIRGCFTVFEIGRCIGTLFQ